MANFYGVEVPGAEGRSGMVAFALDEGTEFDVAGFQFLLDRTFYQQLIDGSAGY